MKIIVVGMDNSGKTTLCDDLTYKLKAVHVEPMGPGKSRKMMLDNILLYMERDDNVIFERFSIFEELVYGRVLRGESKFTFDDINLIRKYKPIIIYCRPSNEVIFNFGKRPQMKGVKEEKEKLLKAWDELIFDSLSGFKIIKYDYTRDKLGNLLPGGIYNEYYTRDDGDNSGRKPISYIL